MLVAHAPQDLPLGFGRPLVTADEERAQRQQIPPPEPLRATIVEPEPLEDGRPVPGPGPAVVAEVVEVAERIADGRFTALPYRRFPVGDVAAAFHYMAQGKHIGKIVVSFEEPEVEVEAARPEVRPDATYLVTGGFGGLGLACARGLVEKGARHIALLGRRGETPESRPAIAEIRAMGAAVMPLAADVSRAQDVAGARRAPTCRED